MGILTSSNHTSIEISALTIDPEMQVRVAIDPEAVTDYAEAMADGAEFPAVVVFRVGPDLLLVDGFHRVEAATRAGRKRLDSIVREGTRDEALAAAIAANSRNGLRMTRADRARAVRLALDHWPDRSDRSIAEMAGVSHATVGRIRRKIAGASRMALELIQDDLIPDEGHYLMTQFEDGGFVVIMPSAEHPGFARSILARNGIVEINDRGMRLGYFGVGKIGDVIRAGVTFHQVRGDPMTRAEWLSWPIRQMAGQCEPCVGDGCERCTMPSVA